MKKTPLKRTRIKPRSKKRQAHKDDDDEIKRLCCDRAGGQLIFRGRTALCVDTVCEQCGKFPDGRDGWGFLHFSHIISKAQRGKTTVENCEWICRKCHNTKRHGIKEVDSKPQWSKGD